MMLLSAVTFSCLEAEENKAKENKAKENKAEDHKAEDHKGHVHKTEDHKGHVPKTEGHKDLDSKVSFLTQDIKNKAVNLTVIAAYNAVNYGMNFNGFSKGNAIYKIPTGWTVNVKFENRSPVPHSLVVVEEDSATKLQVGKPYFKGATTPNATLATAPKRASFSFVADEAGDYAFACAFPAHSANGQWIKFEVSNDFKKQLIHTKMTRISCVIIISFFFKMIFGNIK